MIEVFKCVAVVGALASTAAWAAEQPDEELPGWVVGAATGVGVTIGLAIHQRRQRKKNVSLWASLEPVLQKGPATLQELADGANLGGFLAKGKVVLALQEMTTSGRVEVIDAPPGTPQLEKVKFIKYKLTG
jgi:hypothetical protein